MYCIKCGVELADSEKKCPLCGTHVFHPQLLRPEEERLYPADLQPPKQVRPWGALTILTALFLLPMFITLLCDLQINRTLTWSGYVIGALLVGYVMLVLPFWFRKPNPMVFVPCNFAAIGLFLLFINWHTDGDWFLSFAFPVTGCVSLIVTAVVALTRYIRRGRLYIYGGAALALGAFMPLMELLMNITFGWTVKLIWSLYPLIALILLGGTMLVIAACRPLRESLSKRLFI